jgi:hypothetical protein
MARRSRRNSAEVISQEPPEGDEEGPNHVSVTVRKIDNGYISTHSTETDGTYTSREEYHAEKPTIEEVMGAGDKIEDSKPSGNHLSDAVALLRGKGK